MIITFRRLHSILMAVGVMLVASCSSDDVISDGGNANDGYIGTSGTIAALEFDDTRSSQVFSSTGMTFSWEDGDAIRIYPKFLDNGEQPFTSAETAPGLQLTLIPGSLTTVSDGKVRGNFGVDGERYVLNMDGSLGKSTEYLTIYPDNDKTPEQGYTAIPVDYTGQTQASNVKLGYYNTGDEEDSEKYMASERAASAHLGDYDYLYGAATQSADGNTHFEFQHLQATIRLYMEVPEPENPQIFDSLMILHNFDSSSTLYKFTTRGTLNLETQTLTPTVQPKTVSLKLGANGFDLRDYNEDTDEYSATYSDEYKRNGKYYIVAYMELYPVDMTLDNILTPTLYLCGHRGEGQNEVRTYYKASLSKKKILAGKAYQWTTTPDDEEPITFEILTVQQWEEETGYNNGDEGRGTENW